MRYRETKVSPMTPSFFYPGNQSREPTVPSDAPSLFLFLYFLFCTLDIENLLCDPLILFLFCILVFALDIENLCVTYWTDHIRETLSFFLYSGYREPLCDLLDGPY